MRGTDGDVDAAEASSLEALAGAAADGLVPTLVARGRRLPGWPALLLQPCGQPLAEWATVILLTAPPAILRAAPLPFLGRISYGIYLWHVPFMWAVSPRTWQGLIVLIVAGIAAGWLSYQLIDKPIEIGRAHV